MISETSAKEWLVKYVSDLLRIRPTEVDTSATFDEYRFRFRDFDGTPC